MTNLLDISSSDIAQLNDAELRDLIGLLCEADYHLAHLPTSCITWGGHQDARDDGLDVVVRGEEAPPKNSFIPRSKTGFQVKKPDMPYAKILEEMRPDGTLREEIKTLIREGGAYIIVSSTSSTTNAALKRRKEAMREAVAAEANHQNLYLDFLDGGRIATWVRLHPSLILWVRNKIGRQLTGWYPYENWASAPDGIEEEYILDDGLRLHDDTTQNDGGISVEEGLLKLRKVLARPGTSVRLVGLSGVGKTRLVQALFDERIGKEALNRSQVFYTDISHSPNPDPKALAEQLIASRTSAILIIDNCPPDLHRRVTNVCAKTQSTISLLTVEYDVRDDLPEETSVFRLEPASEKIIEKLVNKRFRHISQIDAEAIAAFSGGNARLAIALATTVQQGETLSGFRDEELFERLFKQRNDPSESLMHAAEVCSLVYSFEGKDTTSEKSELKFLASLIGKTTAELFRNVSTLRARNLIQARHIWRAVLPQAVANRLAKRALETIPKDTLMEAFLYHSSERLITSFTRRLGFLHDCEVASEIASDWLASDGWIGKENGKLSSFGMDIFKNIAPIVPEKTLEAIERAANSDEGHHFTSRANAHYHQFVHLLRHLAYDPALFTRSVKIMCRYALSEKPEENDNTTRNVLKSLFYIELSGTHASPEARADIIKALVSAEDNERQKLGMLLLDATLETWHFQAEHDFDFGARSRDFGSYPQSRQDVVRWFGTFIDICTNLAVSNRPIAAQARKALASKLRGLWTNARVLDELETSARQVHQHKPWNEGWLAVRSIIRYDSKSFDNETINRLHELEQRLKPDNLLERARTYALSDRHSVFELDEDCDDTDVIAHQIRVEKITQEIGAQVAHEAEILEALLPDIVSTDNPRLTHFGKGLAIGSVDKHMLWQRLYVQLEKTPLEKRQLHVLLGFLSVCLENTPTLYHSIMDSLTHDDVLGVWFPILQIDLRRDPRGLQRLHQSLDIGIAPIHFYKHLAWGRRHEAIDDNALADLIKKIIAKPHGDTVAVELLKMRFHRMGEESPEYSPLLLATARDVLASFSFARGQSGADGLDYDLARIAEICLTGEAGIDTTITLCQHLAEALSNFSLYAFDYSDLLNTVARIQPDCFLEGFLGSYSKEENRHRRLFAHDLGRNDNPLNQIPDDMIIAWCEQEPEHRYPFITRLVDVYSESAETGRLAWKPIVYLILGKARELTFILEGLASLITPTTWSGSRADLLEKRLALFESLFDYVNAEISAWAKSQYSTLQETIKNERLWESNRNRERNERFEY